jgi:hypothetical protein
VARALPARFSIPTEQLEPLPEQWLASDFNSRLPMRTAELVQVGLELSWNNFLGGPWRNTRVRDGSWTMMRIEGKWCFGGSRNRIRTVTHNQRGDMFVIAEDGTRSTGQLQGPWIYLTSDDGITIKGDTDFRSNRVNWSTGFFWTWCGRN